MIVLSVLQGNPGEKGNTGPPGKPGVEVSCIRAIKINLKSVRVFHLSLFSAAS